MATPLQSLSFTARRWQSSLGVSGQNTIIASAFRGRRNFTTTPRRWEEDLDSGARRPSRAWVTQLNARPKRSSEPAGSQKFNDASSKWAAAVRADPSITKETRAANSTEKPGFLALGTPRGEEQTPDPEFEEDDVTSIAHAELEQHRELREYARIAAWEMPLLAKMTKPFEPPAQDEPLRFRYTTYMGEQHPAEKKVVLEFCPTDMPDLTDVQREKLKKLVGVRYNPEKDIVKMSCEMFENQAQNKRYLGDLVDSLLREARDTIDTFEDVPLDTRHHTFKVKPKFPVEWRMTEQRRQELEQSRQKSAQRDQQKALQGVLIDGVGQIEAAYLNEISTVLIAEPEMIMAGKGKAAIAKMKKLGVRR